MKKLTFIEALKVNEFWIKKHFSNDLFWESELTSEKPNTNRDSDFKDAIHVIEYTVVEQLEQRIKQYEIEVENCHIVTKREMGKVDALQQSLTASEAKLAAQERVIAKLKEQRNYLIKKVGSKTMMWSVPLDVEIEQYDAELEQLTKESK